MRRPARVLLVRHAPTSSTRRSIFPGDEDLDPRGRVEAATMRGTLPRVTTLVSPARRAVETASLAGFAQVSVEPSLDECDFGRWAGRALSDVQRDEREHLAAWLSDPETAPPGGESMRALVARVAGLLDRLHTGGTTICFTHGGPVKAAVVHTLEAPLTAVWRIDVAPCSVTELRARLGSGWTLTRLNVPAAAFVAAARESA